MLRPMTFAVVLLGLASVPATADIAGQRASGYVAAVESWLDDDEEAALPELARLADQGNTAAQMTLALIDKTSALQGPWLSRLPRGDRVTLLRAPGGISGRSWMHAAAGSEPLAAMWLQLWSVEAPLTLALEFAAAGETRAAQETLVALAARERRSFATLADAPKYPETMRYLIWREWERTSEQAERMARETAALPPGHPQRDEVGPAPAPEALSAWLLSAPEADAIAAFCTDRCAATAPACALGVFEALGGYRTLLVFGTPAQALVPSELFHRSPRGQAALLRRILLNADARGRRLQLARAEAQDACLASALEAEAQRYMPKRD